MGDGIPSERSKSPRFSAKKENLDLGDMCNIFHSNGPKFGTDNKYFFQIGKLANRNRNFMSPSKSMKVLGKDARGRSKTPEKNVQKATVGGSGVRASVGSRPTMGYFTGPKKSVVPKK
jgi:hypothetical protein